LPHTGLKQTLGEPEQLYPLSIWHVAEQPSFGLGVQVLASAQGVPPTMQGVPSLHLPPSSQVSLPRMSPSPQVGAQVALPVFTKPVRVSQ